MLKIRLVEESLIEPILKGEVRCPCHLYSGQEAIAVGICAALKPDDKLFSTHRSHGHFLAKGGDLRKLIAEIYGKEDGCSRGRGGSMHLYHTEKGFCGSAPIVAGTISLALGSALASWIRNSGTVTVSFFGDGAAGEGVLYESLNFAALKRLPIIFACENNLYSTHLPIRECRPNPEIYRIAEPFGIKSERIDGNDVLAIYSAAERAVAQCRAGEGPVFLEFLTYRLRGHVGPDDNIQGTHTDIRPREEIEAWRKQDPIKKTYHLLIEEGISNQEELHLLEKEIKMEIDQAFKFALERPYPNVSDLGKYVYKE